MKKTLFKITRSQILAWGVIWLIACVFIPVQCQRIVHQQYTKINLKLTPTLIFVLIFFFIPAVQGRAQRNNKEQKETMNHARDQAPRK